ncbi:MAG: FHA domain-containing protein [Planctomycetaceae bacterium]
MFGQLIPQGGGDPIPLLKEKLLVGRRSSCDITLEFPNVSSHHCELEMVNGYWHVRDLNSSNGTKVNGERVLDRFIQPGDTLSIAKHHFEISYSPDPSLPAPEERDPFAISLLEKAGLARASETRSRRPAAGPLPPSSRPIPGNDDDDSDRHSDENRAMRWLSEE